MEALRAIKQRGCNFRHPGKQVGKIFFSRGVF
jgi:hypothetical protein